MTREEARLKKQAEWQGLPSKLDKEFYNPELYHEAYKNPSSRSPLQIGPRTHREPSGAGSAEQVPDGGNLTIGPRTRREIVLRVRELKARHHPTPEDRRELFRLTEFLASIAPRDGKMMLIIATILFVTVAWPVQAEPEAYPTLIGSRDEPEHAFGGDGIYDTAQENALLALDFDARIDPSIVGPTRDAVTQSCVARFREAIDAGVWPQWRPPGEMP